MKIVLVNSKYRSGIKFCVICISFVCKLNCFQIFDNILYLRIQDMLEQHENQNEFTLRPLVQTLKTKFF
jgi:hypothetical protein